EFQAEEGRRLVLHALLRRSSRIGGRRRTEGDRRGLAPLDRGLEARRAQSLVGRSRLHPPRGGEDSVYRLFLVRRRKSGPERNHADREGQRQDWVRTFLTEFGMYSRRRLLTPFPVMPFQCTSALPFAFGW